jgi:tellurite resistance protein TerC
MSTQLIWWLVFGVLVIALLALDLGVFHRRARVIRVREALIWSAVWISLSLIFNLGIYFAFGTDRAVNFFTGYLVEKSLSVDNLFVFLVIFTYFNVPANAQHKVLFWGIMGAIIIRGIFIFAGVAIIERLHWVIYIFGAFLVYTGIRLFLHRDRKVHPEHNPFLRLCRRFMPVTRDYREDRFCLREAGRLFITPLFLVVLVVETTDILFAVDSIPAVLSITLDPFIVYTSNIFAILGLRALYFALAGVTLRLHYLSYGLSLILVFLGFKMLFSGFYRLPVWVALGVVAGILAISTIASFLRPKKAETIAEQICHSEQKN